MIKVVRNNIIRNTRYVSRVGQGDYNTNWDEDYNAMVSKNSPEVATTQANVGMRIEGGINGHQMYSSYDPNTRQVNSTWGYTLQDYRADLAAAAGRPAAYGNGLNTNKFGPGKTDVAFASPVDGSGAAAILDALITNPRSGDLSLKAGINPLVDGGTVVPNIADCYAGSAPDIGAIENGASVNCTSSRHLPEQAGQRRGDVGGLALDKPGAEGDGPVVGPAAVDVRRHVGIHRLRDEAPLLPHAGGDGEEGGAPGRLSALEPGHI
jgi:hypothetical protein